MAFLLMCGDVDPNSGPTVSLPCGVCKFEVMDSDKAMCCDLCDKWIHVACDPSIDESVYDDLVLNPTSDLWFCSNCCNPEAEPQTSPAHFNCVCMNVRSIISKKLDLLAYVTAHSYDLIAVTETFLDGNIANSEFSSPSYVVFRHDRNRHGGGVLILVRDSIPVFRRFDLETGCELIWLQITTSCQNH